MTSEYFWPCGHCGAIITVGTKKCPICGESTTLKGPNHEPVAVRVPVPLRKRADRR